jgi:hypothetical protein
MSSADRVHASAVISHAEVTFPAIARFVRGLPGVLAVVADPLQRQLVVRYDQRVTSERSLRMALWPREEAGWGASLLARWPSLARWLNLLATLLRHAR